MYKNKRHIFERFCSQKGQIAVLIDPEKIKTEKQLNSLIEKAEIALVDYFFIGGSTVTKTEMEFVVNRLKKLCSIPLVIFPGSSHQIAHEADGILLLSLLSGRNPDYLIGHHVLASQELHRSPLEIIPTAYILIDGGNKSSVAYVSQTTPIPSDKEQIAVNTAIAGILQGKQLVYFDAGSGAKNSVPVNLLHKTQEELPKVPIIVGGGIRSIQQIEAYASTANVIVIGNHIEDNINFLLDIANYKKNSNVK